MIFNLSSPVALSGAPTPANTVRPYRPLTFERVGVAQLNNDHAPFGLQDKRGSISSFGQTKLSQPTST
jgi:hypothetical protein